MMGGAVAAARTRGRPGPSCVPMPSRRSDRSGQRHQHARGAHAHGHARGQPRSIAMTASWTVIDVAVWHDVEHVTEEHVTETARGARAAVYVPDLADRRACPCRPADLTDLVSDTNTHAARTRTGTHEA